MKKLFTLVFVLSFVVTPVVSHAGLFDFLRSNQSAQIRTTATTNTTTSTSTTATYRRGDRAAAILQAQQALSTAGLYTGDLSGLIGPRTEAAIKAWQTNNRLPATGILDAVTLRSIVGRGADNERGGGENRDGEFNGNFATTPPSLDYLQARCNANEPAFVRILTPWEGDQYVYDEDGAELQIFVCDATGTGNTHLIEGIVSQQIDVQTWSAIGLVASAGVTFDDSDMTPYGANTWLINYTFDENHFSPGHYSLLISDEGGYKINNTPQYGANVYTGWTRPFEVTGEVEEDDGLVSTECNAQLLYPHPGQSYNLEENSNGTGYSVQVHVFLYMNPNLYNSDCIWDISGITFPIEGNNPPGGSAGLVSFDGGSTGYPMWIQGGNMYHQVLSFNPNNPNTPAGAYDLKVFDGEGHEIIVPINVSY